MHRFSEYHRGAVVIASGPLPNIHFPGILSPFLLMRRGVTINAGIVMMGPDNCEILGFGLWMATSRDQSRERNQHPVSSMLKYDAPE